MKFLLVSLFVLFSIYSVFGGEIAIAKNCDSYNVTTASSSINSSEITGKWYVRSTYGPQQNCSTYEIKASNSSIQTASNYTVTYSNDTSEILTFTLSIPNNSSNVTKHENGTTKLAKIFTKNGIYVLWSCIQQNETSTQSLVVLSRNATQAIDEELKSITNATTIDGTLLHRNNHTVCDKSATTMIESISLLIFLTLSLLRVL